MMKRRLMQSLGMASFALAIAVSASAQSGDDRQQMIDMVLQLQQLQDEIRLLRGQIEEQAFEIETLKRRQRDQYLDLDGRLNELAAGGSLPVAGSFAGDAATTMPPTTSGAGVSTAAAAAQPGRDVPELGRLSDQAPEVREPIDAPSTVTGLATPQVEARTAQASPEAEKTAYDDAFQALKDLRYADAAQGFSNFLDRYPGSEYADNAQYWLGESYYVTRNYELALDAFARLQERFPDSSKLPDSLLKIGYTHYELRQWDLARAALTQVQEQYPNTTLARLAESRLRSMRLEGHF
jgi:tol-pal system protein YbgF